MKIASSRSSYRNRLQRALQKVGIIGAVSAVTFGVAAPVINQVYATQNDDTTTSSVPYNGKIAFIGDSLTAGVIQDGSGRTHKPSNATISELGGGYAAYNYNAGGETLRKWMDVDDTETANRIQKTKDNNVKVASIMLGTNDAWSSDNVDTMLANMNRVIDLLKQNGVEKFILNEMPFATSHNPLKVQQYNSGLLTLVDGKSVFMGDTSIYTYTKEHQDSVFSDSGTHLNDATYDYLGKLWANAYRRIMLSPQTTTQSVASTDDSVVYTIGKDNGWFAPATNHYANVLIDNQVVTTDNYTVTGDSTKTEITLAPAYVKSLIKGNHSIEVRYNDGVSFTNAFTLTEEDNGGTDNNQNSVVPDRDNTAITAPNTGA